MIKIDPVLKLLKNQKEMAFEEIFIAVKSEITSIEIDEAMLKADLYVSMIDTKLLINTGGNIWGIRSNYSIDEISRIESSKRGFKSEEIDEFEETKELKLKEELKA